MNINELHLTIEHYGWNAQDEENITKLKPHMEDKESLFVEAFYEFIERFRDHEKYLSTKEIVEAHKKKIGEWFVSLFASVHDEQYLRGLFKIGLAHVKIGLPPHYLHASFTFIREFINQVISDSFSERLERDVIRKSANRLLDINMDVIDMSYREEELRGYLASSRTNKSVINFISQFSFILDLVLTVFLVLLAVIVALHSAYEIFQIIYHPENVSKHVVSVLGNMLILWAMSELLDESLKHLRGGKFAIKIFVSVGLAAIVREILIIALSHNYTALGFMTATLLALGIVYYLMARSEQMGMSHARNPHQ